MNMLRAFACAALVLSFGAAGAHAQDGQDVRIGFVNTSTGGGAVIGDPLRKGWDLALERLQGKFGGLPAKIVYGDDQMKPDVAITVVDRMLGQDKVHFVVGPAWTNLMLAVKDRVLSSTAILISTVSGPSQLAGSGCSPYFFAVAWQSDQIPEATAQILNDDNVDNVYVLAPNYQAGRDVVRGFQRVYKGRIVDQNFFQLGLSDFQAELSAIRAKAPAALAVFAPGGMGIAFMKQWATSGLADKVKLYTMYVIDHVTLASMGDAANGSVFAFHWNAEGASPATREFVRAYQANYNAVPSIYAMQAYDAALLIDSAVKATGGKLSDRNALVLAMRKADFPSVRGALAFGANQFPVQDFFEFRVMNGANGIPMIKTGKTIFKAYADPYHKDCRMPF
ncbi:MAG: ABC transporter substrate-binding protein [Alphaproteobacteria bacterium]